jgi:large subunit ribosomal protein L16
MFEVGGLPSDQAIEALTQATYKFSIKTKVVGRQDGTGDQA